MSDAYLMAHCICIWAVRFLHFNIFPPYVCIFNALRIWLIRRVGVVGSKFMHFSMPLLSCGSRGDSLWFGDSAIRWSGLVCVIQTDPYRRNSWAKCYQISLELSCKINRRLPLRRLQLWPPFYCHLWAQIIYYLLLNLLPSYECWFAYDLASSDFCFKKTRPTNAVCMQRLGMNTRW